MSDTVSEKEIVFPPDYWQRQDYYRRGAESRAKVDVEDTLNRLSSNRKNAIRQEMEQAPISIHPNWVSFLWSEIQLFRGMTPKNEEDAAELEIALTRLVLKAMAEERVTDPSRLAMAVLDFRIPRYEG